MVRYGLSLIIISYCLWRNNWLLSWDPEPLSCKAQFRDFSRWFPHAVKQ